MTTYVNGVGKIDWNLCEVSMIGLAIAHYRREKGLKQVELADKAGLAKESLNRIEKGRHNPSERHVKDICEALELDPNDLIVMAGHLAGQDRDLDQLDRIEAKLDRLLELLEPDPGRELARRAKSEADHKAAARAAIQRQQKRDQGRAPKRDESTLLKRAMVDAEESEASSNLSRGIMERTVRPQGKPSAESIPLKMNLKPPIKPGEGEKK